MRSFFFTCYKANGKTVKPSNATMYYDTRHHPAEMSDPTRKEVQEIRNKIAALNAEKSLNATAKMLLIEGQQSRNMHKIQAENKH